MQRHASRETTRIAFKALVIGIVLLVALSFVAFGYENTWRTLWNIPTIMPPFEDMRVITGAAQTIKAGLDPTTQNVFDPSHQPFNYPQIWYPILRSPIDTSWTIPLAALAIGLFFTGIVFLPATLNKYSVLFLLLTVFSPAVMLGIERANVDIVFFFLLVVALLATEFSPWASLVIVLIATVFKLFPIFGIGYFVEQKLTSTWKYIIAGLGLSALYFLGDLQDMLRVFRTTLKGDDLSYGVTVFARRLGNEYAAGYHYLRFRLLHIPVSVSYADLRLVGYVITFVILGCAIYIAIRYHGRYESSDPKNLRAFRAGAGIYVGTFLLGNNHDYRLMFLLLTIPFLAEWSGQAQRTEQRVARLALAGILLSSWYLVISRCFSAVAVHGAVFAYLLDQLYKWFLFAIYAFLLGASLPTDLFDGFPGLPLRRSKAYS